MMGSITDSLRTLFPHGHPDFIPLMIGLMELHSRKNYGYAHGGDPLGNFERRQKILALYPGLAAKAESDPAVIALLDILKQLDAALWQVCQGYEDDLEGVGQRLMDVPIYATIARILFRRQGDEGEDKST